LIHIKQSFPRDVYIPRPGESGGFDCCEPCAVKARHGADLEQRRALSTPSVCFEWRITNEIYRASMKMNLPLMARPKEELKLAETR
jgi:hypothetical protein